MGVRRTRSTRPVAIVRRWRATGRRNGSPPGIRGGPHSCCAASRQSQWVGVPPPPGQPPDPPDPGGGDVPIGGTPIAEGVMILISLALGYAGRKLYNARKRKISE